MKMMKGKKKRTQGVTTSRLKQLVILVLLIVLASGCAETVTFEQAAAIEPVGFWNGLLHGIIAPISFIVSLFSEDIAVYAIYNNGGWYDFGFLLGISLSIGGSSSQA